MFTSTDMILIAVALTVVIVGFLALVLSMWDGLRYKNEKGIEYDK
jgi:hypothetical protein